MPQIPRPFINDVIARCDLVEYINSRVPLQKRGTNFIACCPFHDEKTPSFTVSPAKQMYHCFGCGVSGNIITFVLEFERVNFTEAVEILAERVGLTLPEDSKANTTQQNQNTGLYETLNKVAEFYHQQLANTAVNTPVIAYLKQRSISPAIAKEYSLGYAPPGWNSLQKLIATKQVNINNLLDSGMNIKKSPDSQYDRFRQRLMFPIRDSKGRTIGFGGRTLSDETPKYLNSPETPIFHKGHELYGIFEALPHLRNINTMLVVEGYMDTIALAQHDIRNVVATLGTATTPDHIRRLFRYTSCITFCFDGDAAGKKAAWRALENALPLLTEGRQIKFIFLPDGEDPDSLIRKESVVQFKQRIEAAMLLSDFFFSHLSSQADPKTIEGKAQILEAAGHLLNKLPQGALQQLMRQQLAKFLDISQETPKRPPPKQAPSKPNKFQGPKARPSPLQIALALLLQHVELIKHIETTDYLAAMNEPDAILLLTVINLLKNEPTLTTATLLENWRETEAFAILNKLASWQHTIPPEGVAAEFMGALQRLKQKQQEHRMEQLLHKSSQTGLSDEERKQLYDLLVAKHDKSIQSS